RMEGADRSGERGQKMIDVSVRALRRMRRLVEDYFTIERLQEGAYDLRREHLPLGDLVQGVLQALPEKDGISTEGWSVELGGGKVACEGDMLRRGFRALFEHMARGTEKARLSVSARGGEVHIRAETPPV